MITDSDRAKYALPVKKYGPKSLIEKADEAVDIRDIMKQMKLWAPTGTFYSYKINCPFAYEHADGGLDKNCRLFGSTNIFCWAEHGYLTPTRLYARWKHIPQKRAAEILLDERGLLYKGWRNWWNELLILREDRISAQLGSQTDIISALHTVLENYPMYVEREFDTEVRLSWAKVLKALDLLWVHPNTNLDILQQWFNLSLKCLLVSAKIDP